MFLRRKRVIYYLAYSLCLTTLAACTEASKVENVTEPRPLSTTTAVTTSQTNPTTISAGKATLLPNTPAPTLTPSSTPWPTRTRVPTPTLSIEQAQATQEALDPCLDTTVTFENSEMGSVRWRTDEGGDVYCCQHAPTVYQIDRNPDLTSNLVVVSVVTDGNVPVYSDNVLIDLSDGSHKILGHDYTSTPHYVTAWLPEERLAWADAAGEVYIGSLEAQEALNVPAKMTDLWFIPPDRLLTRDDTLQFWYYDLTNAAWTPLSKGESEKIAIGWVDHAAVSDDGSYVFFHFESYVALLSNDTGSFEIIHPETSYSIIQATEGDTFFPPQQIKGTPYWIFPTDSVIRQFAEFSYPSKGVVVDSTTAEIVGNDILGIPHELAIANAYLSPDRTQVAVEVVENINTLKNYPPVIAQTWFISFPTGETRVKEGAFAGWETEDEDYLNAPLACMQREITIDLASSTED